MNSLVLKIIFLSIGINYCSPINSQTATDILDRVVQTYSQLTTYEDEGVYTIIGDMQNSTFTFKINLERNGDLSLILSRPNSEYSFRKHGSDSLGTFSRGYEEFAETLLNAMDRLTGIGRGSFNYTVPSFYKNSYFKHTPWFYTKFKSGPILSSKTISDNDYWVLNFVKSFELSDDEIEQRKNSIDSIRGQHPLFKDLSPPRITKSMESIVTIYIDKKDYLILKCTSENKKGDGSVSFEEWLFNPKTK